MTAPCRLRLALALTVLALDSAWAGEVTGRVFVDANADGAWQPGDEPLPGVLVSDGISTVATAEEGAYSLATPDGPQVIFVVNPTGTWPEESFHRYLPQGAGVADFALLRQEQSLPFYFVQGTDLHVRTDLAVVAQVQRYVQAVNDLPLPIAFVVHTGDLVVDTNGSTVEASRALFTAYREMVSGLTMPLIELPGNHEYVGVYREDIGPSTPGWGSALYQEMIGPLRFAFTYAGVCFIAMDGSDIIAGKLSWSIPPASIAWLRDLLTRLDPQTPLVLLIHEPFLTVPGGTEVEQALVGRRVLVALSGHGHGVTRRPFAGTVDIMGGATSYSWHGGSVGPNPIGYHVVKITADGFESAFADWAESYSLTVNSPSRYAVLTGETRIDAALFDPREEVTRVEIDLGDQHQEISELVTEGLTRNFTATVDAAALPRGVHEIRFTLHGAGEPFVEVQPFIMAGGPEEPFAAEGPATLRLRMFLVNAPNRVLFNGAEVATMPADAADEQPLEVTIPAESLRRLNTIEFESARLAGDAGWDDFRVDRVELACDGRSYGDQRYPSYGLFTISPRGDQPGRFTLYVDITYPRD